MQGTAMTHIENPSVIALKKVYSTMGDNLWNVALFITGSEFPPSLFVGYAKSVHINNSQSV
jgi:hypothetical protein